MPRTAKSVNVIVVSANGMGLAYEPEVGFIGAEVLRTRAETAVRYRMLAKVHPLLPEIEASLDNLIAVYAAMTWACGGRDVIIQAPEVITDLFADFEDDTLPDDQVEEVPTDLDEE
jgi:hypothetical protein